MAYTPVLETGPQGYEFESRQEYQCRCSSTVEHIRGKNATRVRLPSPAPSKSAGLSVEHGREQPKRSTG